MDASQKPLRMPQSYSTYAERHELFKLFQVLMQDLVVEMPDDPLQFLIDKLELPSDIANLPKIIINGPPMSGKYSLSYELAERLRCIHIVPSKLPEADATKFGLKARKLLKEKKAIPPGLWAKLFMTRVRQKDCQEKGWVINGFPRTRAEMLALQAVGVTPKHYFSLKAETKTLEERVPGKLIDPRTGDVYNRVFRMPTSSVVEQRLVRDDSCTMEDFRAGFSMYNINSPAVDKSYEHSYFELSADQPFNDVKSQLLLALARPLRIDEPRTPRLVLFGPIGSGKSTQAALLAERYRIVNIACDELVKQEVVAGTPTGRAMQPFVDRKATIPDELVMKVLRKRLDQPDSQARGWVVHGFPTTSNQANTLEQAGYIPDRVVYLNVLEQTSVTRLSNRRVDPVTGARYHLIAKPPDKSEISARLIQHPDDDELAIQKALAHQAARIEDLRDFYAERAVEVEGASLPHVVMQAIESVLLYPRVKEEVVIDTSLQDDASDAEYAED